MTWRDERLGFGSTPAPCDEDVQARLKALSPEELVPAWREASTTSLRDRTDGTYAVSMYFDRLGHDEPERAVSFIDALLAQEPDNALVALTAQEKLLGQLLHFNGPRVAGALQELALRQPRLRWLMGGATWSISGGMVEDEDTKRRLLAIADKDAFEAWEETYRGRETPDFAALSVAELAPLWAETMSRSDLDREKDEHWSKLFDFQNELVNNDPLKALELVKAILEIEANPNVLGLLAAGMLEDLIPSQDGPVVDAVVAEAARNPRFRHLLGGVWFYSMSPEVTEKLEKARGGERG
ncbi:MAG: DUF6869 domain-containing protein [Methyloceanibacter sp.]